MNVNQKQYLEYLKEKRLEELNLLEEDKPKLEDIFRKIEKIELNQNKKKSAKKLIINHV